MAPLTGSKGEEEGVAKGGADDEDEAVDVVWRGLKITRFPCVLPNTNGSAFPLTGVGAAGTLGGTSIDGTLSWGSHKAVAFTSPARSPL